MSAVDLWSPNTVEHQAALGVIADIRCWYDEQSLRARTQRVAQLVSSMRQTLLLRGPAVAVAGRVNLGSLMVAAMDMGDLRSLEIFADMHIGATDGSQLKADRPSLIGDLEQAEQVLAQLAQDLASVVGQP